MKTKSSSHVSRRKFLGAGVLSTSLLLLDPFNGFSKGISTLKPLAKAPVDFPHFPDKAYAFIWRNWDLVPVRRIASVIKTTPEVVLQIGKAMGLPAPSAIPADQQERSYLSIIRRNWHLLPREQLLELLQWTDEQLTFTLQEDDFFYIKLGSLKPECQPVYYTRRSDALEKRIASIIRKEFPTGIPKPEEPLFQFVKELSSPPEKPAVTPSQSGFSPRFGYAYFALFGDPLLNPEIDPYPNGYLDRMSASGMDGTWMHIVLSKLTPFPWNPEVSDKWEQRLQNLKKLVERAKSHGIGIYLYLNEPRHQPLSFFDNYPELKGASSGDHAALCTSNTDVQNYLVDSLATITETIPDLAGFFSITASENPTNCWSHGKGGECGRCGSRGPANVIAELNGLYLNGIKKGIQAYEKKSGKKVNGKGPQLISWDWGWADGWAEQIIPQLPKEMALMSVSEWDLPIERGGIKGKVGEYSISSIGPGPRATRHWAIARENGLRSIAKIQAGTTWEIAAVPYVPALENVATHAANLRDAKVDGLMLGWTLGGHPSPNLEVVAAIGTDSQLSPLEAMKRVAQNRVGKAATEPMVAAWQKFSKAFSEFPYNIGVVYNAPLQAGPSNLLWEKPTGYAATMVGIAYDDINAWKSHYPIEVFIGQLNKVADGFLAGISELKQKTKSLTLSKEQRKAITDECNIAETVAIHYQSVANQAQFNEIRNNLPSQTGESRKAAQKSLEQILLKEITLAKRMFELQTSDSRFGFEATNHYFYVPVDLLEKIINCHDLLDRWLPKT